MVKYTCTKWYIQVYNCSTFLVVHVYSSIDIPMVVLEYVLWYSSTYITCANGHPALLLVQLHAVPMNLISLEIPESRSLCKLHAASPSACPSASCNRRHRQRRLRGADVRLPSRHLLSVAVPAVVRVVGEPTADHGGADGGGEKGGGDDDDDDDEDDDAASDHTYASHEDASGESEDDDEDDDDEAL